MLEKRKTTIMVDVSAFLTQAWFVLLFSLIVSLLAFPLVVVFSFVYDYLEKRHAKTPKILWMLICTFLATLVTVVIIEFYLGYTLPQVFSTP